MKKFQALFFFFDNFVVYFKIFVILSNIFFTLMSSNSLSSTEPNLVTFKILIFREDILKNVYKRILSHSASIFPLYTLIPNSEFEFFFDKNLIFSMINAARRFSNSSINRKFSYASFLLLVFKTYLQKMVCILKKPLNFQLHFTQSLVRNIYLNFV